MTWLDRARAAANARLERLPGKLGDAARKANELLGRPLADAAELEDRRAFAVGRGGVAVTAAPGPARREQAPVIVYYMDKQTREVAKLTDVLEAHGIAFTATNIQEDPAAQYAVKRDSRGIRLPVVFIAGDCLGGREQLVNAAASGELTKKVFG